MTEVAYFHLDAALLRQIQRGRGSVAHIFTKNRQLAQLAEPCRAPSAWISRLTVKEVIEFRLQALSEAGLIVWNGSHWQAA